MAISWVSGSGTTYASRTNTTVTAPASIANGDLLLAFLLLGNASEAVNPSAIPSGFAEIGTASDQSDGSFNVEFRVYWKIAASEAGNYTFTHASASSQGWVGVFRGVNTTTPQDATATTNGASGTSVAITTFTGLTTATAGAWIVALGHDWGDTTNNLSPPSGMTERFDTFLSYVASELISAAGATGNRTMTNNNAPGTGVEAWGARLVALRPATGTNGTASGGTITVAGSLLAGAVSGVRSPTAAGATLPAVGSLLSGTASGVRSPTVTGATISAPATFIAGTASGIRSPTAAGATLISAGSLIAGTASGIRSPTVAGQVLSATGSIADGTASGIRSPTVTGQTLTTAGSIIAGTASAGAAGTAAGATLTVAGSLLSGTASAVRSPTVAGQTLTRAATFIAGNADASTTIYVRKTGNNTTGDGSTGNPYLTIPKGIAEAGPGDTVIVGNGTYTGTVTVQSNLILRAENQGLALLRATSGNCISGSGVSNVEIDGFDINTTNSHGIEIQSSHHITVRNVISHNNPNSGISLPWGEFLTVEDCTCYGNGRGGWYSGITFYQSRNITGDTTTPGPRNVIRNCLVYDNWTTGGSTDGNGILMDDWQHTQSYGPDPEIWLGVSYPYGGLVENCIAYGNGNKGIGIAWCNGVTIRNNVCYKNGIDGSQGTWRGDLSNQAGRNNTFANNIAVADSSGAGSRSSNTAIGNYAVGANGEACTGTVWFNNLTYHTNNTGSSSLNINGPGCATPTVGNGNKLATNPLFVNAAAFDFHLQATSPCINAGTATYGLPANDNEGNPRISGASVDIGAYEYDTGTATAAGATLTAPASLLAGAASTSRTVTGATLTVAGALTAGAATGAAIAAGQTLARAATITGGIATGGGSVSISGATVTVAASVIAGTASAVRNPTTAGVTIMTAGTIIAGSAQAGAGATAFGATLTATATLTAGTARGDAVTLARTITAQGGILAGTARTSATVSGQVFTRATTLLAGAADGAGGATAPGVIQTAAVSLIAGTGSATSSATAAGVTITARASLKDGKASAPRKTEVRAPLDYYRPVVEQTLERPAARVAIRPDALSPTRETATSPSRAGTLQTARRT